MSLSIVPGYDFTFNELVTSEKLRKWIGGAHNTASLTASEVGVTASNTGDNLHTTATWATSATVGALTFNTSTGWVELTTDVGSVPIFGTQGGLFTKRLREGESSEAAFDRFYEGDVPNVLGVKPGLTPTLPAANYSTGEGYDNFGMNSVNVAAAIQGASDLSGHRASKTFARYPSDHSYNPAGAWTVATYVTGISYVHSLYKLGGLQTLRFSLITETAGVTNFTTHTALTLGHAIEEYPQICQNINNPNIIYELAEDPLRITHLSDDGSTVSIIHDTGLNRELEFLSFDPETNNLYCTGPSGGAVQNLTVLNMGETGISAVTVGFFQGTPAMGGTFDSVPKSGKVYVTAGTGAIRAFDVKASGFSLAEATPHVIFSGENLRNLTPNTDLPDVYYSAALYNSTDNKIRVAYLSSSGSSEIQNVTMDEAFGEILGAYDGYLYLSLINGIIGIYSFNTTTGAVSATRTATYDPPNSINTSYCRPGFIYSGHMFVMNWRNYTPYSSYIHVLDLQNGVSNITAVHTTSVTERFSKDMINDTTNDRAIIAMRNRAVAKTNLILVNYTETVGSASTAVSGLRGGVSGGVWEVESSTATNNPTRIVPLSQCFNYYGAQQLSVGFVQAILGKTDFRTGGYEF